MCNSCGCRDAESFEAQIGYQGARDFVSTMKGRIEGANKEGYFPADEEDFQEFVLDTMEDHIDLADWMERHGAENQERVIDESLINLESLMTFMAFEDPTGLSEVRQAIEHMNCDRDTVRWAIRWWELSYGGVPEETLNYLGLDEMWKRPFGAEGEGMSLKESAKVGFGLGAGLLGFRIVAITGAVALGALLSRR